MATLAAYNAIKSKLQQAGDSIDAEVSRKASELLDKLNDFADKHGIQCQYRLALPPVSAPEGRLAQAGIEVGKVQMPKTLIAFLQNKTDNKYKSANKLYGVLLKHQKFDVKLAGSKLRVMLGK